MLNEILRLFEEIYETDKGSLEAEDVFRDFDEWDSLTYLTIISRIDDEYDVIVPREEFEHLKSIRNVAEYIEKHRD